MTFENYSNYELFCALIKAAQNYGCRLIEVEMTKGKSRRQAVAKLIDARKIESAALKEFYERAGPAWSPHHAQISMAALVWMTGEKQRRGCCSSCRGTGGWKWRDMHFWTHEPIPQPLAQVMMLNGAPLEQVQRVVADSLLLCTKCARRHGAKLLRDGQPALDKMRR